MITVDLTEDERAAIARVIHLAQVACEVLRDGPGLSRQLIETKRGIEVLSRILDEESTR